MKASEELQFILQRLTSQFTHVSLRGQGRASFVFAEHNGRAVEISEHENKWWLELWEVSPDPDAAPVKEATLQTSLEAVKEADDWLAGRSQQVAGRTQESHVP